MSLYIETLGQGPDVVMLHGWGLHGGVFSRVAAQLATQYCVHLVDLPGHGGSPSLPEYTLPNIVQVLVQHFPLPVQVVGWSLGGLVAQYWAASLPEQVKSLALIATSPRFVRDEHWPHAQAASTICALASQLDQQFETTLARFLALQMLGAPQARATISALQADLLTHGRPQGLHAGLNLLLQADVRALASQMTCPCSLFFGARDAITPLAAGQWLAEHLADARLHTFAQASHAPFLSHEAQFTPLLQQHLDQYQ